MEEEWAVGEIWGGMVGDGQIWRDDARLRAVILDLELVEGVA